MKTPTFHHKIPYKLPPSRTQKIDPKTLEQSIDIELVDDDLWSLDSNGDKRASFKSTILQTSSSLRLSLNPPAQCQPTPYFVTKSAVPQVVSVGKKAEGRSDVRTLGVQTETITFRDDRERAYCSV